MIVMHAGGDGAVLCNPAQTLAALITSLDPAISAKQDCEALQALQYSLLRMLCQQQPDASYPAALCTLGDLEEVQQEGCTECMWRLHPAGTRACQMNLTPLLCMLRIIPCR